VVKKNYMSVYVVPTELIEDEFGNNLKGVSLIDIIAEALECDSRKIGCTQLTGKNLTEVLERIDRC